VEKVWATIGYAWESADSTGMESRPERPCEMQGPALDPLHPQSEYSEMLLDLFREVLCHRITSSVSNGTTDVRGTVETGPSRCEPEANSQSRTAETPSRPEASLSACALEFC